MQGEFNERIVIVFLLKHHSVERVVNRLHVADQSVIVQAPLNFSGLDEQLAYGWRRVANGLFVGTVQLHGQFGGGGASESDRRPNNGERTTAMREKLIVVAPKPKHFHELVGRGGWPRLGQRLLQVVERAGGKRRLRHDGDSRQTRERLPNGGRR